MLGVLVILLAAGVLEGRGEGGVVAGVGHRELVVELRHVRHDEELVGTLAPHHVINVQQLRDAKLLLRQAECQQTIPENKIKLRPDTAPKSRWRLKYILSTEHPLWKWLKLCLIDPQFKYHAKMNEVLTPRCQHSFYPLLLREQLLVLSRYYYGNLSGHSRILRIPILLRCYRLPPCLSDSTRYKTGHRSQT